MKKPIKNIDGLFKEKLKGHEVQPPADAWQNIEARLHKKKRRFIPIWLQLTGAAVIIGLLGLLSINYLKSNQTEIPQGPVLTDSKTIKSNETSPETNPESITIYKKELDSTVIVSTSLNNSNTDDETTSTIIAQINKSNNNGSKSNDKFSTDDKKYETTIAKSANKVKIENSIESKTQPRTTNSLNELEDNSIKSDTTKETIVLVASTTEEEKELDLITEVNPSQRGWSVAPVIAPIFFDSFNNAGSPIDNQFESNAKNGSSTVSYGVKVNFALNNKWSIQSGVSILNVGYSVQDVVVQTSGVTSSILSNVSYNNEAALLNVNSRPEIASSFAETSKSLGATGDLNQEFGYVEIPLEVKYRITNGKFGVHVVAGFSSLILNNNDVFVSTNDFTTDIGEANNLNNLNFSGNFGLDFDYLINRKLFINVAPMLKLQTNTFSATQNFEPYVIGVYTGINYKF
ncbi:hypothetical protein KH5_09990 [Urechidicola sp. KH5]